MSKKSRIKSTITHTNVQEELQESIVTEESFKKDGIIIHTKSGSIRAYEGHQKKFVETVKNNDVVFVIGPAGTGKTFISTALAVAELKARTKKKIILCRPAVEIGNAKIGFLPGDIKDKLDPFMQPLYDSLYEMIAVDKLKANMERRIIQIVHVGHLRGRTFNDAFLIIDEAQNLTLTELKMILTRVGKNCKIIIAGDITQIDLPKNINSGLIEIQRVFKRPIKNITFFYFDKKDIVRSEVVGNIISAFEEYEGKK